MPRNRRLWRRARLAALDRAGWRCQNADCGIAGRLEVHHVIPLSFGGTNADENLITLCRSCHLAAHQRTLTPQQSAWQSAVRELELTNAGVLPQGR